MPEQPRKSGFSLDDYVTVAERIGAFYGKFPDGSLQSELVELNDNRVVMRAYAYRTSDDPRPGIGYSSLGIPGTTPYTRGSEVENCESSAWGRAIAALGFEVKRGIASAEEVRNKQDDNRNPTYPGVVGGMPTETPEGGLIGTAISQGTQDFNLRQTPDGFVLPFRVKNGSHSFIVVAENRLAEALDAIKATVIDNRVTVWGSWSDETTPAKGTKPEIHYRILHLARIRTDDGVLPADVKPDEPVLPEPGDDVPLMGEAETSPLGLVS
jgi:hypothetical protein